MKQLSFLLPLLFLSTFELVGQSNSFEKGYFDGYCQAFKESKPINSNGPCPVLGSYPLPAPFKESYQDGFSAGYSAFNSSKGGGSSSTSRLLQSSKNLYSTTPKVTPKPVESASVPVAVTYPQTLDSHIEVNLDSLQRPNDYKYVEIKGVYNLGTPYNFYHLRVACKRSGFKVIRTEQPYRISINRPKAMNLSNSIMLDLYVEKKYTVLDGIKHRDDFVTLVVYDLNGKELFNGVFTNTDIDIIINSIRRWRW